MGLCTWGVVVWSIGELSVWLSPIHNFTFQGLFCFSYVVLRVSIFAVVTRRVFVLFAADHVIML